MQLSELKALPVQELISLGEECGLDNASRMNRQDVVFGILKNKAKQGEDIAVSYTHLTLPTIYSV